MGTVSTILFKYFFLLKTKTKPKPNHNQTHKTEIGKSAVVSSICRTGTCSLTCFWARHYKPVFASVLVSPELVWPKGPALSSFLQESFPAVLQCIVWPAVEGKLLREKPDGLMVGLNLKRPFQPKWFYCTSDTRSWSLSVEATGAVEV